MAKKIQGYIRLQLPAGAANPAPPVGPALGAQGVNIMAFCKDFNARTKDQNGMILPVVITVYTDKSFTFILKSPPASVLLKKAANQPWTARDRMLAERFYHDPAVTNRLLDQAYHSISARRRNGYSFFHRLG